MDKNIKTINELIKRKGFVKLVREKRIKDNSKKCGAQFGFFIFFEYFNKTLKGLKEEMQISGKRVLDEKVVKSFLNGRDKKGEINY